MLESGKFSGEKKHEGKKENWERIEGKEKTQKNSSDGVQKKVITKTNHPLPNYFKGGWS